MQTAPQHTPMDDHDHKARIDRLASALNAASRAAAADGLSVDVGILCVETLGRAITVPQLAVQVAREVEVR